MGKILESTKSATSAVNNSHMKNKNMTPKSCKSKTLNSLVNGSDGVFTRPPLKQDSLKKAVTTTNAAGIPASSTSNPYQKELRLHNYGMGE